MINLRTHARSADAPETDVPPSSPAAEGKPSVTLIDDHRIHSFEYGGGDSTLLLLHGLSGSSRWWSRNVADLARDHRVLVPDLIGFGRSRRTRRLPGINEVARLLIDWLRAIEVPRISLVGHSMGGQISVHIATSAPQLLDRLVLVDSSGIPRPISGRALLRFATEVGPMWRWGDPSFLPTIAGDALAAGPRVLLRAIHHLLLDDVRPLLPRIEAPTLLLWGERDSLVPIGDAMHFRENIPGSRLAVLRGAGHNPMVDRPADFNRILRRFLDGETVGR